MGWISAIVEAVGNERKMEQDRNLYYDNRQYVGSREDAAHQREVKDLKAAGLNPMLAYMQGGSDTSAQQPPAMSNSLKGITASALAIAKQKEEIENLDAQHELIASQTALNQQEFFIRGKDKSKANISTTFFDDINTAYKNTRTGVMKYFAKDQKKQPTSFEKKFNSLPTRGK